MQGVLFGVMGHVDHGKTALVKALTGTDTDRLEQERRRGISIELGFALLQQPNVEIEFIDMPGHERFVRTMIAGATGIGAALLVVAANEGPRPQTFEHMDIARAIGVSRLVVALTKCDLVGDEQRISAKKAIAAMLARCGFGEPIIVPTSVITGEGVAELSHALAEFAATIAPVMDEGLFCLHVDRAFAVAGTGPVVTGTLRKGCLRVGDSLEIAPLGRPARVRSLQSHGRPIEMALPGRRLAVGLRGVGLADLRRGLTLCPPGTLPSSTVVDVMVEAMPRVSRPLAHASNVRLLLGTCDVVCRLKLFGRDALAAGERGFGQLVLNVPVASLGRQPFILRSLSPVQTVAGGRILDPCRARQRSKAAALTRLQQLADADADGVVAGELARAAPNPCTLQQLARLLGCGCGHARSLAIATGAVAIGGPDLVMAQAAFDRICQDLLAAVRARHRRSALASAFTRSELSATVPCRPEALDAALRRLLRTRALVRVGGGYELPGFEASKALSSAQARAMQAIESAFKAGGLSPPDPAQVIAGDSGKREATRFLVRQAALIAAPDRGQGRTIIFHATAIARARSLLAERLARPEGFLVGEAGQVLGISRKFSVPLLELLDRIGFTRRCGDRRYVTTENAAQGGDGRRLGPGGPPGLQNQRPAHAGGGFDSHPPPPAAPRVVRQ